MDIFSLAATLTLDSSDYEEKIEGAKSSAEGFGGKIGSALGTAAKVGGAAVAAIGTATVAAGGAFVKGAGDVAAYGDNIDKMSQKMGMSSTAYQEWDAVMQHSGTSMETLKASMKTLANAAESGSDAFQQLGISQEDIANMSQEELFSATITALQNVENETTRTYLAGKTLGRGATELGALLNTSAEDTQAMKDRVHELGGVMSEDAVKASAAYQDSLQDLQTAVGGLKRGIVSDFLPSITTVMDGLQEVFAGDGESGVAIINEGVSGIITNLTESVPRFFEVGGQIMQGLFDAITQNLPMIMSSGTDIIIQIVEGIVANLPTVVQSGLEVILSIADGVSESLPRLIPTIVDVVLQIVETLIDNVDKLVEAAAKIILALADGLIRALPRLLQKAPEIISKLVRAFMDAFPTVLNTGMELMQSLIGGIVNNLPQLLSEGAQIIAKLLATIAQNLPEFLTKGIELVVQLGMGLIQAIPQLISNIPQIISSVVQAFSQYDWGSIGWNLITGIGNGIANGVSGLINTAVNAAASAFNAVKSFLGIASPSKKARDILGKNFAKGFGIGFEKNMPIKQMVDSVEDAFDEIESVGAPILGAGVEDMVVSTDTEGSGGFGTTYSPEVNINVYASENQNVKQLAREIQKEFVLWEKQRGYAFA